MTTQESSMAFLLLESTYFRFVQLCDCVSLKMQFCNANCFFAFCCSLEADVTYLANGFSSTTQCCSISASTRIFLRNSGLAWRIPSPMCTTSFGSIAFGWANELGEDTLQLYNLCTNERTSLCQFCTTKRQLHLMSELLLLAFTSVACFIVLRFFFSFTKIYKQTDHHKPPTSFMFLINQQHSTKAISNLRIFHCQSLPRIILD